MIDVTAPIVCLTLAEKADAAERFALDAPGTLDDWQVIVDPELDGWVIRWHYLRVTVGSRGDLALGCAVARERGNGRRHVIAAVTRARRALGWGRGAPVVRCLVCRTSAVASEQHAPGSAACRDTQEERRIDHAT